VLQQGSVLSWNVWFTEPQLVDREEWRTHAERWRHSIDHQPSPLGGGTQPKFADQSPYTTGEKVEHAVEELIDYIEKHV
jgi:hypothetical protein